MLYYGYGSPPGLDWDVNGGDDPFVDDESLESFNADQKSDEMYRWVIHERDHYKTNQVLVMMGEDFHYLNAHMNFQSTDKLISYFNSRYPNITLMYSTPYTYIKALQSLDVEWPTKYDDMFPYADHPDAYWTGYFSSRANDKEYIRRGSQNINAATKLYALKALD